MKEQIMERPLMGGVIRQRVDNSMLCLTDLARLYEVERIKNGWIEKRIDHVFTRKEQIERFTELLDLQNVFINVHKHTFIEQVNNQGLIKALKSISQYATKGRGANKAVYVNHYIFIAVAQWLNPRFWAHTIIWVTDELILNRIEAGEYYNKLCSTISTYMLPTLSDNGKRFIFSNMAKLINKAVFGEHKENLRQTASKEQLQQLKDMELKVSTLIEVGYLKTYQDTKDYLKIN